MKTRLRSFGSPIVVALVASGVALAGSVTPTIAIGPPTTTVIDSFSTNQSGLTLTFPPAGTSASSSVSGAGMLGGEHDLQLTLTSGVIAGNTDSVVVSSGFASYSQDATIAGVGTISWDGADGSSTLDSTGLGGVDLTGHGTQDAFQLNMAFDDLPATMSLTVYSDAGNASAHSFVTPGLIFSATNFVIPFSSLVTSLGGGADFTDVGAVVLSFGSTTTAPDLVIDSFSTTATLNATMVDSLAVDVNSDTNVDPGDTIGYTVVIANADDATDAATTTVAFNLAPTAGTSLVTGSVTTSQGTVATGNSAGHTVVSVTLGTVADGASVTITFRVLVGPFSGNVANQGTVSASALDFVTDDPAVGGTGDPTTTAIDPPTDVAVTKSASASVLAGDAITYSVTLTNNGPGAAASVALVDLTPAGTTFAEFTQTSGPTFTTTTPSVGSSGTMTATLASLASGASASFTIVVTVGDAVPGGTVISNTATASTTSGDVNLENNSASASTTVSPTVDLSLSKSLVGELTAGSPATYSLTVSNAGPDAATSTITMTDTLPAGLEFVSAAGTGWTCVHSTGVVTCSTDADLVSGASSTVTLMVNVSPAAAGTIVNSAAVSSAEHDPTVADRDASASAAVAPATTTTTTTSTTTTVAATTTTVAAATTTTTAPPASGVLPNTGAHSSLTTALALFFVTVGLGAIAIATRRRSTSAR